MKRILKKEYRMYFLVIILLLLINITFFVIVVRISSCDAYKMATQCLSECGADWTLKDYFFYCSCSCTTGLGTTAIM